MSVLPEHWQSTKKGEKREVAEMKRLAIPLICILLAACAAPQTRTPDVSDVAAEIEAKKQRELVVKSLVDSNHRLQKVGYRLLSRGVSLCEENTSNAIGVLVWNIDLSDNDEDMREAVRSLYGLSNILEARYVIPDSPADKAGMQAGDKFISVNGWSVPIGQDAAVALIEKLDEYKDSGGAILFTAHRDGKEIEYSVTPEQVCNYKLEVKQDNSINAYADGEKVVMHSGIMDFFRTDEELALIVSHEIAHNSMEHIKAKKKNQLVGGALGFLVDLAAAAGGVDTRGEFTKMGMNQGALAYSVDFEKEADYVALYLMALADYEIDNAADFWRRMAVKNPDSITISTTHPTSPERFVGIEKSIAEVQAKLSEGIPLRPEMKEKEGKREAKTD